MLAGSSTSPDGVTRAARTSVVELPESDQATRYRDPPQAIRGLLCDHGAFETRIPPGSSTAPECDTRVMYRSVEDPGPFWYATR